MSNAPLTTYIGVTHPWMCDTMGHVNVRHYMAMFDDASFQLLGHLTGPDEPAKDLGWADVRCDIEYRHEILPGTPVTVHSAISRIGRSSLTYVHRLSGTADAILRAQASIITTRFDLLRRCSVPLEAALRGRAEGLLIDPEESPADARP